MINHSILTTFLSLVLVNCGLADVVINEIFYNAPADFDRLEYVELHNTSTKAASLGDWQFSKGIEYTFPKDATIDAGGFLVLCAEQELFKEFYGEDADGVFAKSLDNGGETLTLKNADGKKVDSVKYDDKAPWAKSADGYSASLERICPTAPADAANWAPSVLSDDYSRQPSGTPGKKNSTYAATLPPIIDNLTYAPQACKPNESITVAAIIPDTALAEALLCYRYVVPGAEGEEVSIAMERGDGDTYTATIPGTDANRIVRFRIKATNTQGDTRYEPHQNDIRPAYSVYVSREITPSSIPVAQFFNIGQDEFKLGAEYRTSHAQSRGRGRGEFGGFRERRAPTEEERLKQGVVERLSESALEKAWSDLTLQQSLPAELLLPVARALGKANSTLTELREWAEQTKDIRAFTEGLDERLAALHQTLIEETAEFLTETQLEALATIGMETPRERGRGGRGGFGNPADMLPRVFNVEQLWFRSAMLDDLNGDQLTKLAACHQTALEARTTFADKLTQGDNVDFRAVFEDVSGLSSDLRDAAAEILTEDQTETVFGRDDRGGFGGGDRRGRGRGPGERETPEGPPLRPQGRSAFIYTDPELGQSQLFDFVNITQRKSGYKVRLHKDRPLHGMTTINVLYERSESSTLNEALAYEAYQLAGNATAEAGFMRVLIDGELAGYHLWFEQPNGSFFRRQNINDKGNLYKLIWMGSHRPSKYTPQDKIPDRMDIVGKHEKMTHPHDGYEDIVNLIETLENAQGDDAKMWQAIQENFDVDQVINYFAVNSLLSHWDGFFNNYFLYHDTEDTKKWTIYPWDQDSTWSQRMGNPQELSTMPLNYGAEGARPPGEDNQGDDNQRRGGRRGFGGMGRGGMGWWRDGGDISRPLLANPQFYERFCARLKSLAETVFTEEVFAPKINAIEQSIEPEVRLRAKAFDLDAEAAVSDFRETMDVFREHLKLRRAFVLKELGGGA